MSKNLMNYSENLWDYLAAVLCGDVTNSAQLPSLLFSFSSVGVYCLSRYEDVETSKMCNVHDRPCSWYYVGPKKTGKSILQKTLKGGE
jgi:hypothetical protein